MHNDIVPEVALFTFSFPAQLLRRHTPWGASTWELLLSQPPRKRGSDGSRPSYRRFPHNSFGLRTRRRHLPGAHD